MTNSNQGEEFSTDQIPVANASTDDIQMTTCEKDDVRAAPKTSTDGQLRHSLQFTIHL